MQYLPLFVKLTDKPVLIVGGGTVALRKAGTLLEAGARLFVVAQDFHTEFLQWQQQGKVQLINGSFEPGLLNDKLLVIAATDDEQVNQRVYQAAEARQILVNTVDDQPKCRFIFPSVIDRSPVLVAISSGGTAPVLARRLREKLETLLPQYLGPLAGLVGSFRDKVKNHISGFAARRQFWETVFNSDVVRDVQANRVAEAGQKLETLLNEQSSALIGEVFIVGAGPGDPELLTLKALQLMQQADVVVYDNLVSDAVLNLVRRDAERICVGKKAGDHSTSQQQINQLLVKLALEGKKVCRLKGGDPFIFGRGGEEIQALVPQGITFQVVPGITAAAGCAAYAGIPLTHRDYAQSVQFITGHCQQQEQEQEADWLSFGKPQQTLVIYMGLLKAGYIQQRLLAAGRAGDTPVAIIENGTRPEQRVICGQLDGLAELIEQHQPGSPSLLIIGEVVSLQSQLQWFGAVQHNAAAQPLSVLSEG